MAVKNKFASFLIRYQPGTAKDLPLVSPHALDLVGPRRSENIGLEDLHKAFLTDPFLASKICAVANSIFFAHNIDSHVLNITAAIDRVGVDYARSLIIQAPSPPKEITREESGEYWAHCMAVAAAATELVSSAPELDIEAQTAHFLGLVHDIGYLVELHYNPQLMSSILATLRSAETVATESAHAPLGENLLAFWSLPKTVQEAMRAHHDLRGPASLQGKRLGALVHLADALALNSPLEDAEDKNALELLLVKDATAKEARRKARSVHENSIREACQHR